MNAAGADRDRPTGRPDPRADRIGRLVVPNGVHVPVPEPAAAAVAPAAHCLRIEDRTRTGGASGDRRRPPAGTQEDRAGRTGHFGVPMESTLPYPSRPTEPTPQQRTAPGARTAHECELVRRRGSPAGGSLRGLRPSLVRARVAAGGDRLAHERLAR